MTGLPPLINNIVYSPLLRSVLARSMAFYTRQVLRQFERNCRHSPAINQNTLRKILRRHQHTEFGIAHDFAAILSAPDFLVEYSRRVPLSQYSDYEPALERMTVGANNLLCADPVIFFAPSSGTTGKSKMIPITARGMRSSLRTLLMSRGLLAKLFPRSSNGDRGISLLRMADNQTTTAAGIPTGDASAAGLRRAGWVLPFLYSTPVAALQIADKPSAIYIHLVFGLLERDLNHISATFAHYALYLFRMLETRWPDLLETIASGRLPADLLLSESERKNIEAQIRIAPSIAKQLRAEFEKGFENIAQRLWPNLQFLVAVTTGSFAVYIEPLRRYTGAVPICNLFYGATEAFIGINTTLDKPNEYALIPGSCVYEFIPVEDADLPNPAAVGIDALQVGREYELVISNDCGFYRYRMDDVIRVTGVVAGNPHVEFCYRRGTILNLAAEKTAENQVADVLHALARNWRNKNTRIIDYTVIPDASITPPCYLFFIEIEDASNQGCAELQLDAIHHIDAGLAAANVDYRLLREGRAIGMPAVHFVASGSFEKMLGDAPVGNAVKVARKLRNPQQLQFLMQNTLPIE